MADLSIFDGAVEGAIGYLVRAGDEMRRGDAPRPNVGFDSLTGIAGEVESYLRGLQVGRAALADAAMTAGHGLNGMMHESHALDARLAAALNTGFVVQGARP